MTMRLSHLMRAGLVFAALLAFLFIVQAPTAQAGEIDPCQNITFPYSVPTGDTAILSQVVACANSNGPGLDVINLQGGSYDYSTAPGSSALVIDSDITINGNGATIRRFGAQTNFRIFDVQPGAQLNLNNVNVDGGNSGQGGNIFVNGGTLNIDGGSVTGGFAEAGGGIYVSGGAEINIQNATLSGNDALGGGAIYFFGSISMPIDMAADAPANPGVLTLTNVTVSSNSAGIGGGGLYLSDANVTINGSSFSSNLVSGGDGGAIYVSYQDMMIDAAADMVADVTLGSLNITNTDFTNNGASPEADMAADSQFPQGGAIYNDGGAISISGGSYSGNYATMGGAIFNGPVPDLIFDAASDVANPVRTIDIDGATFDGNSATFEGGAIYNLGDIEISSSTVQNNTAGNAGAGVYNVDPAKYPNSQILFDAAPDITVFRGGTFASINTNYTNNDVESQPFDMAADTNGAPSSGGAIYNDNGAVEVDGGTFSGNDVPSRGGAIHNVFTPGEVIDDAAADVTIPYGIVNIANATFDTNTSDYGGAIYNDNGDVVITGSTVQNNQADFDGGAIFNRVVLTRGDAAADITQLVGGTLDVQNTDFTNNTTLPILNDRVVRTQIAGGSGGAIYNSNGAVNINGGTFSGNTANLLGGAVVNGFQSQIILPDAAADVLLSYGQMDITGATFTNNAAAEGGALMNSSGYLSVAGSSFTGNQAATGGAISSISASQIFDVPGQPTQFPGLLEVVSSTFTNNGSLEQQSRTQGGGAIASYNSAALIVDSSTFTGNAAGQGGAVYFIGSEFDFDMAADLKQQILPGGALIVNNTVTANTSEQGALYLSTSYAAGNNTLVGNIAVPVAPLDGGPVAGVIGVNAQFQTGLANNIITGSVDDQGAPVADIGGEFGQVQNNLIGDPGTVLVDNTNIVGQDPLLGALTGTPAYFPLLEGSPAIDAGNSEFALGLLTIDQAGNPRVQGDAVDIGSIETPPTLKPVPLTSPTGTIDPATSITLTWDDQSIAESYIIDVYSPSGELLSSGADLNASADVLAASADVVLSSSCTEGVCSYTLTPNGETGEYVAWIIATDGTEFGDWTFSTFTVAALPNISLSSPTLEDQPAIPGSTITLQWPNPDYNQASNIDFYYVDVYTPSGTQLASEKLTALTTCSAQSDSATWTSPQGSPFCSYELTLNGEEGIHEVWISATVGDVFYSDWTLSEFDAQTFGNVELLSPSNTIPPAETVTLEWNSVRGATGYFLDVYAPDGTLLVDDQQIEESTCPALLDAVADEGFLCSYELSFAGGGQTGEYTVWLIPYDAAFNFGQWRASTFTIEAFSTISLTAPTEKLPLGSSSALLEWDADPNATGYYIDVYSPGGSLLTVGPANDAAADFAGAGDYCFEGNCFALVSLPEEAGEYVVWIIPTYENLFFGEWAQSTFEVGLADVMLTSPTQSAAPAGTITLTWDAVPSAAGYFVDVIDPAGTNLTNTIEVLGTACQAPPDAAADGAVCALDISPQGEFGEYFVYIIPYTTDYAIFGDWTESSFTIENNFVPATLTTPSTTVAPANTVLLEWDPQPDATGYLVDVYSPSGELLSVAETDMAADFIASCSQSACQADVTLNGELGEYSVWIIPTADFVFYGAWANSTFTVDLGLASLSSPTTIPVSATTTLVWPEVEGAAGYFVDVYAPTTQIVSGQEVLAAACVEGDCSLEIDLNGETGTHAVYIIPYAEGYVFGTWNFSSFDVTAAPLAAAEVDVLGSAAGELPSLDTSEVEAAVEGPGN